MSIEHTFSPEMLCDTTGPLCLAFRVYTLAWSTRYPGVIFFGDIGNDTSYGEFSSHGSGLRILVSSQFGDRGELAEFVLSALFVYGL